MFSHFKRTWNKDIFDISYVICSLRLIQGAAAFYQASYSTLLLCLFMRIVKLCEIMIT